MHHTDKYNIQCVDKTVKCACISELAVMLLRPFKIDRQQMKPLRLYIDNCSLNDIAPKETNWEDT
ncbi:MAG: hypothetical protein ACK5D8_02155, partial [Bacteroidota bacterium]